MRLPIVAMLFCVACAMAQEGPNANQTDGPPMRAYSHVNYFDGSNRLIYTCIAASVSITPTTLPTVSAGTNANPVAFTIAGHGFDLNANPIVKITGATGGWVGVNGSFTATIVDANTLTVPVDSTTFGAFGAQALTTTTQSPRLTLAQWAIKKVIYDASSNPTEILWATGATAPRNVCANRTSLSYQ